MKGLRFRPSAALVAVVLAGASLGSVVGILPVAGAARPASAAEPSSTYVPLDPARVLDTRTGTGRGGAVGPIPGGSSIELPVTGVAGVPATGVEAVTLNVTATNGTALHSYLTVFPTGGPRPLASNINFTAGTTVPNQVIARVGTNGRVTIYNNAGNAHVVADVQGWYASAGNAVGSRYAPVTPARVLDTRDGLGQPFRHAVGPGETIDLTVAGRGGLPTAGISAVTLNVTATGASGPDTFVTVFPSGTDRPLASNLNVVAGQTVPNLVTARVNDGKVSLYNNAGFIHLIADVQGWYASPSAAPAGLSTYTPVAPVRALDTRDGTGTGGVPGRIGPGGTVVLPLAGTHGIPASGVSAVVLNVTAVDHFGPDNFVTVYPAAAARPLASNLNVVMNQTVANLVVARVDANGAVSIYNNLGALHLVADVQGWFTQA
jgi:hypothetical protein